MVAKRVLYAGNVQGVGFRYTAQSLAGRRAVAGYVRNLPGGEVELVAEGEPAEVDAFLADVARRMGAYITSTTTEDVSPAGHAGFRIRT
jgi:acylphosphatase